MSHEEAVEAAVLLSNWASDLAEYKAVRLVAQTAPVPIWIKSYGVEHAPGTMVYQNDAFLKMFHCRCYIGETDFAVFPPALARKFRNNDRDVLCSDDQLMYTHWLDPRVTDHGLGAHTVAKWVIRDGDTVLVPGMVIPTLEFLNENSQ